MPPFVIAFWILKKASAMPPITKMMTSAPITWDASCPKPSSPKEPLPRNFPLPYRIPVTPLPSVAEESVRFHAAP